MAGEPESDVTGECRAKSSQPRLELQRRYADADTNTVMFCAPCASQAIQCTPTGCLTTGLACSMQRAMPMERQAVRATEPAFQYRFFCQVIVLDRLAHRFGELLPTLLHTLLHVSRPVFFDVHRPKVAKYVCCRHDMQLHMHNGSTAITNAKFATAP